MCYVPLVAQSSPRRVLKSIVGPALGVSLASLLATTPLALGAGCQAEAPRRRESTDGIGTIQQVGMVPAASPDAKALLSPPDAGRADASAPASKPKPDLDKPGIVYPPPPGTVVPPQRPPVKVGILESGPDHSDARPLRPTRRSTDREGSALRTGLGATGRRTLV